MADQDFQEEDVWSVVNVREESNKKASKPCKINKRSSSSSVLTSHDGTSLIPRCCNIEGTVSSHNKQQQSSAPMSIPYKKGPSDRYYQNDDDGEMVPPHEYIARKLAIEEWTLKGRDLNKLRDAILTKTGFLE